MSTITAGTIAIIIDAVGAEPDDRNALADDLRKAHAEYQHLADLYKNMKKSPSLKAIRKAADALAAMIDANPLARQNVEEIVDLGKLCDTLRRLETANRGGRAITLKDYFFGGLLPSIFEQRFGQQPTVTRSGRSTRGGRFLRFATAVSEALRLRYGSETILKAFAQFKRDAEY
jgi:hypothetical protein